VWVEVAAEGVQNAILYSQAQQTDLFHLKGEDGKERTATWYRLGGEQNAKRRRPGGGGSLDPDLRTAPPISNDVAGHDEGDEALVIDIPSSTDQVPAPAVDELEEEAEEPDMILERPSDGSRPKAWKRQQLGWYGAMKAIVGYSRPRRVEDVPFGTPAYGRRKTRTL
jgi:hypothetical protein